jgi:hypothetical protein
MWVLLRIAEPLLPNFVLFGEREVNFDDFKMERFPKLWSGKLLLQAGMP